jgi:uncharacterized protein (DUF2267 family)
LKTPVKWNDPTFIWKGPEDITWGDAYRVVQEVVNLWSDWSLPNDWQRAQKKLPPEIREKFIDVVIKVNGLTQAYKKPVQSKPKITIDHVQKTLRHFGYQDKISVKAEIK